MIVRALLFAASVAATPAGANPARAAMLSAFAQHCFSPHLTAASAAQAIAPTGARHDFYDLDPLTASAPSSATSEVAPGTDRRCEVAFDGDAGAPAAEVAIAGLAAEGIEAEAALPVTHAGAALPGTTLLGARYLNPGRVAVVHTGTRPGPDGVETFLRVERLTPGASLAATEASARGRRP